MFFLPFSFRAHLPGACLAFLLALVSLQADASDISWQHVEAAESPRLLEHGKEAALFALAFSGVAYRHGGNSPETGMDCSGFVVYVYKEAFDVALPRTAAEIEQSGMPIEVSELQPGDLLFYNTLGRSFSHVGIYLGDAKFIHAPRAGAQIRIENMRLPYWTRRFDGARRIGVS
jgi:cell wall-associated NlpC family hydrolase